MANTYSGRARGAIVTLNTLVVADVSVGDTGELPSEGGAILDPVIDVDASATSGLLNLGLTADAITSETSGGVAPSDANSANSSVDITNANFGLSTTILSTVGLTAAAINVTSAAICGVGVSGTTSITDLALTILGLPVSITVPANPIPVNSVIAIAAIPGVTSISLILNEQIVGANTITVNAVHLSITLTLPVVGSVELDVILGQAHSDITCVPIVVPIICVFAGAKVKTVDGFKKIEDIGRGDMVVDENGKLVEVINMTRCPGGWKGFTILKKGCFGENLPSDDISITDGHPIRPPGRTNETSPHHLANKTTIIHKHGEIPHTYSLITERRAFVMMNNIPVATWADDRFDYSRFAMYEYY